MTELFSTSGPWLHLTAAAPSVVEKVLVNNRSVVARKLRGSRMKTTAGLFDEFAAALQFPSYFGNNWDALEECLNDLEWFQQGGVLLVTTEAEKVLSQGKKQWVTLLRILNDTGRSWSERPAGAAQPSRSFHSVFVFKTDAARGAFVTEVVGQGVSLEEFALLDL